MVKEFKSVEAITIRWQFVKCDKAELGQVFSCHLYGAF